MRMTRKTNPAKPAREFERKTITLPAAVAEFADKRAAQPEYAGNVSAYVRSLIIADKQELEQKAA